VTGPERRSYQLAYGAFAVLAVIWGCSFILIKLGVNSMPATVVVLLRVGSGTLTLLAVFAVLRRNPFGASFRAHIPGYLFMALTSSVIPFIAITWGEQYVATGVTSILNATTPLWTAIFAWWVTPNERPSRLNYLGVATGFGGTGILVAPQLLGPLHAGALGTIAVLVGSASYACAALGQRRLLKGVDPMESSLWQLLLATLMMILIAAPALPATHPTLLGLVAVLSLGVIGSAVAYVLYYFILDTLGATRGSSVTFVIPIVAVFLGTVLFAEPLTPNAIGGMAVILFGIFLTSLRHRRQEDGAGAAGRAEDAA
jgi:drug/metabolite transporter (DMT)-like permease